MAGVILLIPMSVSKVPSNVSLKPVTLPSLNTRPCRKWFKVSSTRESLPMNLNFCVKMDNEWMSASTYSAIGELWLQMDLSCHQLELLKNESDISDF